MIKVLMIGPDKNEKGGIASVVKSYYDVGLNKDIDLEYISTYKSGNNLKKIIYYIKSIMKYIIRVKSRDIVHIHMSYKGSFYRKAFLINLTKFYRKKIIIHIHGSEFEKFYDNSSNIIKKLIRNTLKKGDIVIALSEEWKKILLRISPESNVKIIYNSIKIPCNIEKNYIEKNVLFLGRLGKRKGIYDILEICNDIISKFPDVKITLAGDGEIKNVMNICKEYGIDNNVIIPGWTSGKDKDTYLKQATIYILPSYNEGMPISILEAMSYKLPIISTNVGGIPQMISNGKEGYLINAGDIKSMKNVLLELLSDVEKRKHMGNLSYERVYNNFNLEKNINVLKKYYTDLLK